MPEPQVNGGELIFKDIENNPFLNQLHQDLLYKYAVTLLGGSPENKNNIELSAVLLIY